MAAGNGIVPMLQAAGLYDAEASREEGRPLANCPRCGMQLTIERSGPRCGGGCDPDLVLALIYKLAATALAEGRVARNGDTGTRVKLRELDVATMVRTTPPPVPWVVAGLVVEGMLTVLNGREARASRCSPARSPPASLWGTRKLAWIARPRAAS
jgi:hypothetical protein